MSHYVQNNLEKQKKEYLAISKEYELKISNLEKVNSDQLKEINKLKEIQGNVPDKKAFIASQKLDIQEEYLILEHRIKSLEDVLTEKEIQLKERDDILDEFMNSSMAVGAVSKIKYDDTVKEFNKAKSELISLKKENEKITLINKVMETDLKKNSKDSSVSQQEYSKLKQDYEFIKKDSSVSQQEYSKLKQDYESIKKDFTIAQQENSKLKQDNESIKKDSSIAQQEYLKLKQDNESIKKDSSIVQNEYSKLKQDNESTKKEILKKDEYIEVLKVNIIDLNNKLANNELLILEISNQNQETEQQLLAKEEIINVLNFQIENKAVITKEDQEEAIKLKENYRSLEEELENYKERIVETETQINILQSDLTGNKDLIRRVENEKKMLNKELEEKEKTINKFQVNIEDDLKKLIEIDSLITAEI